MNILLIGSGGREHALAWKIAESPSCNKLYAAPGNPGIFNFAEKAEINPDYLNQIKDFCVSKSIDLVVVGPEKPLANGLTDYLNHNGLFVFGPTKLAAQLESSKYFAKEFMKRHEIPTAKYVSFSKDEREQAIEFVKHQKMPLVIKADGLASGKGVVIVNTNIEAKFVLYDMFAGLYGSSGYRVVIEEFMYGEEVSVHAITDGTDFKILPSSQDHKNAEDGDKGKNTGGMGAYASTPFITQELNEKILSKIIIPTIDGMKKEENNFQGCLYAGLMICDNEPYVVEYNVRFGDPETQALMPLIEGDFAGLLNSSALGNLNKSMIEINEKKHVCSVVMSSGGYPEHYKIGYEISGIEDAENSGNIVFHAGTDFNEKGKLVTSGGRVLSITGTGENLKSAIEKAYSGVNKISFKDQYFRNDIGKKGLLK